MLFRSNFSTVVSGLRNKALGIYSSVLNGSGNTASGFASAIIGGTGHTVSGINSVIIGGANISGTSNNTVYLPKLKFQSTTTLPSPEQGIMFFSGSPLNRIMYNTGGTAADWIII